MKWQPIEAAPLEDDLLIIGYSPELGVLPARYNKIDETWEKLTELYNDYDITMYETWTPTHWMPLPEPPAD